MNKMKKRIASIITAAAVAVTSIGVMPRLAEILPDTGGIADAFVVPASAVNEYSPYDFYTNSERVVLPEDIIEILEVAGCSVDNNDYGKDNPCRKIRIYVDSDGKNLLGIYDTYDNSVATITKSGTGWWFVKRDSSYKLIFNWRSITLPTSEHGSVSASISCKEEYPEEGDDYFENTVTLNVTPDAGYCLKSLTVTDASSNPITVTNNTFVMPPESDVTVTAEFQDITTWSGLQAAFDAGADIKLDRNYKAGENDTKLTVPYGKTVNLDLNGHTIDRGLYNSSMTQEQAADNAKANGCVIRVDGTLNLKDTGTDHNGKITGGNSSDYGGGGVNVNGIFNMSGGTISGNHAKCGGGLSVTSSTFNMTGGTISGNNSTDSGGGVYNDNTGVLNISGGTISGNTSGGDGGGIRFGGSFTMSGGTITGNTAAKDGSGVYADYTNFSISGSPVVTGNTGDDVVLFAEKTKFKVTGALTENASIGVKLLDREKNVTDGVFAYAASNYNGGKLKDTDIARFTSTESSLTVSKNEDGKAVLVSATVEPVSTSYVYEGKTTNVSEAIPLNCFMTYLSEGTYVVNSNVNFTKKITLNGEVTIILEDGKTMTVTTTGSDNDYAIYGEDCTLNIYGQSAGTGKLDAKAAAAAYAIYFEGNCSLGIHGGVVNADATGNANASTGIIVRRYTTGNSIVIDGGEVTAAGKLFGISCACGNFNITGGQVTAKGDSGGLAIRDNKVGPNDPFIQGILTLGCTNATDSITITGGIKNFSENSTISGEVKILDGITLTDDVTGYFSGKLSQDKINSLTGTKTLTLASSKEYNGITFYSWKGKTSLPTTAGNYYLAEDVTLDNTWGIPVTVNLDLNGHSIINTGSGPVISVPQNATLNMYDSGTGEHKYIINHDIALVKDSLTHNYKTFTGGYITGGNGSYGGGVLVNSDGTFRLYGGTIIGNSATNSNYGGGVFVVGTFEMHGGSIIGNKAPFGNGGGVYVHDSGKFTMSGGRIIDNYAGISGGGVYFYQDNTFKVSGTPVIKNNTVNGTANNVYIPSGNDISWGGPLGTGAEIGVTMEKPLEDTIASADYTNYITSDNGNYEVAFKNGKLKLVPHTHSFTYTASGDTISATCTATSCALHTTPATLTIGKPAHETYGDGKAAAATITDANSIQGDATVVYYKAKSDGTRDGSALAEAPTDAGKYRAEITLGTGTGAKTAFVVYTIAKAAGPSAPETVSASHTDTTVTVTAPAQTDPATYEYSINSIDWQTGTEFTKLSPNTSYTIRARVAATDNVEAGTEKTTTILTFLTVTVSGTPSKGCTLTAAVLPAGLTDLTYQWYRGVNAISGATESTYVLTADDVGNKLHVAVSLTSPINSGVSAETAEISNISYTHVPAKAPTCTRTGNYEYYKGSDGNVYVLDENGNYKLSSLADVTRPKRSHSVSYTVTKAATCTEAGEESGVCTNCGQTITRTINALGHKPMAAVKENEVEATCTTDGGYDEVVKCERCGFEVSRTTKTVKALGHDYDPTTHICTRCGEADPDFAYTVTFDSNGGSDVATQHVLVGGKASTPEAPEREGYTFDGWYLNGEKFNFGNKITDNITLTAQWKINVYTVTFDSNGGSKVEAQKVEFSKTATKPADPTRDGVTFLGWQLDGADYDFATPVKSDITLVANWNVEKFKVTFDSNGGSAVAAQTVEKDKTAIEPAAPTREGYKFLGWFNGDSAFNFSTKITADITLTAQWEINKYTVTFDSKGGSAVAAQTVEHGKTVAAPEAPTKDGAEFAGWTLGGAAYDFATPVTGNITLTAQWKALEFTITFMFNGELYSTAKVEYGKRVAFPELPASEGKIVLAWYNDAGLTSLFIANTAVTSDLTLYAAEKDKAPVMENGEPVEGGVSGAIGGASGENTTITLTSDDNAGKLTFPKSDDAKEITINGGGNTLEFTGSSAIKPNQELTLTDLTIKAEKDGKAQEIKLTAAKGGLTLENVTLDGKKSTINAKQGDLTLGNVDAKGLNVNGAKSTTLTIDGDVDATKISGFGTVDIEGALTVEKTLTVNNLELGEGGILTVASGASVTINKGISGSGTIKLADGFKSITIKGTLSGKIKLISDKPFAEGAQIFKSSLANLNDVFDVHGIAPAVNDGTYEYGLYVKGGKAYLRAFKLQLGDETFCEISDMMKSISNAKEAGERYTLNLLGDMQLSSLNLPKKGTYSGLTLDGNGHSITLKGNTLSLTGDLTLENVTIASAKGAWTIKTNGFTLTADPDKLINCTIK